MFPSFTSDDERERIREIYERITQVAQAWDAPSLSYFAGEPFKALIAGMLSAQTREEQTLEASYALFELADEPFAMKQLTAEQIAAAIQPVTYAEKKVAYVQDIAAQVAAQGQ